MTEAELKTTWCPWSRTGLHGGVSVNRSVESVVERTDGAYSVYDETRCIGSACAAFRTTHSTTEAPRAYYSTTEAPRAYCGNAGKP